MTLLGPHAYSLGKPTRRCAATGRTLEPGERYVATLVEQPGADRLGRVDFCEQAWAGGARPQAPLTLVGSWRAVVASADKPRTQILDDEAMLDLLAQLAEPAQTDPARARLRFVLALLLTRRRAIVQEARRGDTLIFRPRGSDRQTGPTFAVRDPGLDESSLLDALAELESLAGDQPDAHAAPATSPPAPAHGASA